jgi:hypothetical protein
MPHDRYPSKDRWYVPTVPELVDPSRVLFVGVKTSTHPLPRKSARSPIRKIISAKHMMKALHFFLLLSLYFCLPSLPAAAHQKLKPDSDEVRRVLSKHQTQFLINNKKPCIPRMRTQNLERGRALWPRCLFFDCLHHIIKQHQQQQLPRPGTAEAVLSCPTGTCRTIFYCVDDDNSLTDRRQATIMVAARR